MSRDVNVGGSRRPTSKDAPSAAARGAASPALARAAQGGIHCLAIPTPFGVGRVNCYLIEDDPLTLVDTGPNSATSLMTLQAALADHGRRVEDLQRIVVTHQHVDHIGLAAILAQRSGAELCALAQLGPWLADYKGRMEANDAFAMGLMLRNGIPQDVAYALRAVAASFRGWGAAAHVTHALSPGDSLRFAGRSWRVHRRPGHSPSDTVFHDERSGELIGGDHLIKHISSNPLISLPLEVAEPDATQERPRALVSYLRSLGQTREMELELVLAGHGEPVEDHRELIDKRLRLHERRGAKLHRLIAERPRNAHELAQQMWGQRAITQAYLTLSEVLGHVDLLIEDGRVRECEREGVVYFEAS